MKRYTELHACLLATRGCCIVLRASLHAASTAPELVHLSGCNHAFSVTCWWFYGTGAASSDTPPLQDVLADRKTGGRTTGEQRMNGDPKRRASLARVMGYVEQVRLFIHGCTTRAVCVH